MEQYNEQQLEAVTSNERTILCLAGAGAGKTKTLIGRICRLVNDGVDPTRILCLTFTNAAAFEMKDRYMKVPGIDLTKGVPEFRTFHSFCYSLIIKDKDVRAKLGYSRIPEVCNDAELKELKTKVKLAIGCKLTDQQLENDSMLTRQEKDEKELFNKALIKQIKKDNVITFDIMCYNVCELFVKDYECIQKYKQKYIHVLGDEMQDSDPDQFKFVASFPDTTNFFMAADILQNIYQFRGATNQFIKQLTADPNWKVIKLYENYRSTTNICEFANKFSSFSKDEYRIEMHGQRSGDDVEVIYGSCASYSEPVDRHHLVDLIKRLEANKTETAILCRSNRECQAVRAALTEADIPYVARMKSTDAVNYLEASLSNDYFLEWLSSSLDAKDYADYVRLSSFTPNPDLRWFLHLYSNNTNIRKKMEKVVKIRNIMADTSLQPADKFNDVAKLLRVKTRCTFEGDVNSTNKEVIEGIRDQLQEQAESQIYVGTIHSAKGLEYDTVYVMGVNDNLFKLGTEEMNNLAYVAYTRAKNHLIVYRR